MHRSLLVAVGLLAALAVPCAAQTYTFTSIDHPNTSSLTVAWGINEAVQVVGSYVTAGTQPGYLWSNGVFSSISIPGSSNTQPLGINNSGQVVGGFGRGFILNGGVFTFVDYPGATLTSLNGINDSGQVVGNAYDSGSLRVGFLTNLAGGGFTLISYPGSNNTQPNGINNNGQISGYYLDTSSAAHGFLLSGGAFTPINVPNALQTYVTKVNDLGAVVGYYFDASNGRHGFLFSGGQFTTIDYPGATATDALGINNKGQIVGEYWDTSGVRHGFLATPAQPAYNVCLLYDPTKAVKSGSTIPIKLQLCDGAGNNLSSAGITLHAVSLVLVSTNASEVIQDSGNANPDYDFRYDATLGGSGGYIFNLSTKGLLTGTYNLVFKAGSDTKTYVAQFQVR